MNFLVHGSDRAPAKSPSSRRPPGQAARERTLRTLAKSPFSSPMASSGFYDLGRALNRCARVLRATHDDLQPLQPMAEGRRLGCLMEAITKASDGDVQVIDTSVVRVHQHGAMAKRAIEIDVGRS